MSTTRRYRRYPLKVPLYVSVKGSLFQRIVDLESKDISRGGLAFETSRRIPVEADTRVEISALPGLPRDAHIEGRVVYRTKDDASKRYTIGVAFDGFVGVGRKELLHLIERLEDVQATPA